MSDCEMCRNYDICEIETKGKIDRCFFVYPCEDELAKDTKEYAIGYKQGRADERKRIVAELELLEVDVEYMNQYDAGFNSAIYKALEIVRGDANENEI